MPRHIVNEGRVVGLSSYEVYVKQVLSEDPTAIPATEKEWLNSMVAYGATMLLHVGEDTIDGPHYRDIAFPKASKLCAANTILGEFFLGVGKFNGTTECRPANVNTQWCTEVISYGPLFEYPSKHPPRHPPHQTEPPPAYDEMPVTAIIGPQLDPLGNRVDAPKTIDEELRTIEDIDPDGVEGSYISQLREYGKIIDGLVIHPGNWYDNQICKHCGSRLGEAHKTEPPYNEEICIYTGVVTRDQCIGEDGFLDPDFTTDWPSYEGNAYPRLRLFFSDRIHKPFFVMLHGFTDKTIINGVTHTISSGMLSDPLYPQPQNGAFMGPGEWPRAAKVVFHVSNAYMNYFFTNNYSRQLRPTTHSAGAMIDDLLNDLTLRSDTDELPPLVPDDPLDQIVRTNPVIDMDNTDPAAFYDNPNNDSERSRVKLHVTRITSLHTEGGAAVLTTYQRRADLPPAIFGSRVSMTGADINQTYLNPLDVVSPGTIKLYHGLLNGKGRTLARSLETIPENRGLIRRDTDHTYHQLKQYTTPLKSDPILHIGYDQPPNARAVIPVADVDANQPDTLKDMTTIIANVSNTAIPTNGQNSALPKQTLIQTGDKKRMVLSIGDETGAQLRIGARPDTRLTGTLDSMTSNISNDEIPFTLRDQDLRWSVMLYALSENKSIDVVGTRLKNFRSALELSTSGGLIPEPLNTRDNPRNRQGQAFNWDFQFMQRLVVDNQSRFNNNINIHSSPSTVSFTSNDNTLKVRITPTQPDAKDSNVVRVWGRTSLRGDLEIKPIASDRSDNNVNVFSIDSVNGSTIISNDSSGTGVTATPARTRRLRVNGSSEVTQYVRVGNTKDSSYILFHNNGTGSPTEVNASHTTNRTIRLYITNGTPPAAGDGTIPLGSIGIGW